MSATVTGLEHVLILTDDLEATRDFYAEVVGLTVGERPPLPFPGYWLYAGGVPCLHIGERAPYLEHARGLGLRAPADPALATVDHISFRAGDFEGLHSRVAGCGLQPLVNEVAGTGIRQLFFEDPNGVRLEISSAPANA